MIQVIDTLTTTTVQLICDLCKEPIPDPRVAMVRWRRLPDDQESQATEPEFCHKGRCDKAMAPDRRNDPWWEMTAFLARLLFATGLSEKDAINAIFNGTGITLYAEEADSEEVAD